MERSCSNPEMAEESDDDLHDLQRAIAASLEISSQGEHSKSPSSQTQEETDASLAKTLQEEYDGVAASNFEYSTLKINFN